MAPQGKKSSGVGQGLSDIEGLGGLIEDLENAESASKDTSKSIKQLHERMEALGKAAKRSKDPVTILAKGFVKVRGDSKLAGDAVEAFAKQIEDSTGVMTSASAAALNGTIEDIKRMRADLVASGKGDSREAVMASSKLSQLQSQKYNDEKNFMVERAKNMQGSLNPFKAAAGVGFGVFNAGAKNAVMAAEAVGHAMGLSAGVMMLVTEVLIAVTLPFMALIWAAKESSKMINDMAKAGNTMNDTWDGMAEASTNYYNEVGDSALKSGMLFKEMQGLMVTMNQEYGHSLGFGAAFAGNVANVGKTFGMANEESVKLATKMAVLGRTSNQLVARNAFGRLGLEAAKLGLPLEALAEPMLQLSELAGKTGYNLDSASNGLSMILRAAASLKTSGAEMFKNMEKPDVLKFAKDFSNVLTGIDEWQLAAMTYKQGESFQSMNERVGNMNGSGRVDAIAQTMKAFNLNGRENSAALGHILKPGSSPGDAVKIGLMAQNAVNSGMSDTKYNAQMAADLQAKLDSRRTAAQYLQAGEDPTAFVMDKLGKLLKSVIDIQDTIHFWKKFAPGDSSGPPRRTNVPASSDYGKSSVQPKRAVFSTPVGPG